MFNLEKENNNISQLCDYIDRMNALNPENPGGISDLAYHTVMTSLHENEAYEFLHNCDIWVRNSYNEGDDYPEKHQYDLWDHQDCAERLGMM
jgi:hypothetical protein